MKTLALLLALFTAGCAEAHPASFRAYALRLDLAEGVCSGTVVGENLVMTATHCLEGNRIVRINGQPAYALKRTDDGKDHSIVRVSIKFKRWAKLGVSPVAGDRIRYIGNPAANEYVYREGYISRSWAEEIWAQVDAFGGDSGAGVFCDDGRICGVVSAGKAWVRGPFTYTPMVMYPIRFTSKQWQEIR